MTTLSPRQIQVLEMLWDDRLSKKQIAEKLGITVGCVDLHVARARQKVGAATDFALVKWGISQNILVYPHKGVLRKLTERAVRDIRLSRLSLRKIAIRYSVNHTMIGKIKRGEKWKTCGQLLP